MTARITIPVGTQYGHLTTRSKHEMRKGHSFVECACVCGIVAMFKTNNLRTGNTLSCGCKSGTHNLSHLPEYAIWQAMKQRCLNPRCALFDYYGGRGITVCEPWIQSFECFYQDMGPRPSAELSIERKDNDGPYAPWNCHWASFAEQCLNRRSTRNIRFQNESHSMSDWARLAGITPSLMRWRLDNGWTMDRILNTPPCTHQPMTEAEIHAIIAAITNGEPERKLALRLGRSRSVIQSIRRQYF